MSKNSNKKKRQKNGVRMGLEPIRTKQSKFASDYQYEVRFQWWANIDKFQDQIVNSGGNAKFIVPPTPRYGYGKRVVVYLNEPEMFILRLSNIEDRVYRAYRLVPKALTVKQSQQDQ